MKRGRATRIALFAVAPAAVVAVVATVFTRIALGQQVQALVRDFYGEADNEITAVTPVPAGMVCGSLSVDAGLTVQTSEPPGGFTGACLMDRPYGGTLPTVCYSPAKATYDGNGTTPCTAPAANVVQPAWSIQADRTTGQVTRQYVSQSYRVMETCAPHMAHDCALGPNGNCPCNTHPVSRSCCTQYGNQMTTSDQGQTATGTAYFH